MSKEQLNELSERLSDINKTAEDLRDKLFDTRYVEGDVVATPRGKGVVGASMEENFEFPVGEGEGDESVIEIEASSSSPAYVVGYVGESAVYRASALESSSFDDDETPEETDGPEALAEVSEVSLEEIDLPQDWEPESLLDWWASIGGTWDDCTSELEDEPDIEEETLCADRKSAVHGTERWRNRF